MQSQLCELQHKLCSDVFAHEVGLTPVIVSSLQIYRVRQLLSVVLD